MLPEGRPFSRDTRRAYGDDKDVGPHPNGLARGPGGRPAERHNGLDKGYSRDDIRRSELDARPAAGRDWNAQRPPRHNGYDRDDRIDLTSDEPPPRDYARPAEDGGRHARPDPYDRYDVRYQDRSAPATSARPPDRYASDRYDAVRPREYGDSFEPARAPVSVSHRTFGPGFQTRGEEHLRGRPF